ncbi:MAG: hypothetical protein KDC38_00350, partial [Planctomycetes bacterium]|nr:hypothetical protein [Planctomycetota bacterium]
FPVLGFARWAFPDDVWVHRFAIWIAAVHPFSVRYGGDAKADAFYALLFNLTLWAGLVIVRRPSPGRGALFGLLLGLAYLVRPEALGLALLLTGGVIVVGWIQRRDRAALRRYATRVLVAGVLAVLCLLPSLGWNALFVHEKVGVWTLSPKAGVLQDFDKGLGDRLNTLNEARTMTLHEEKLSVRDAYQSFSPWQTFLEDPTEVLGSYFANLKEYVRVFPPAVGTVTSFLLVLGIIVGGRRARRGTLPTVLALFVFYAAVFMVFYVSRRFWLGLVPICLPYCAAAAAAIARYLRDRRSIAPIWVAIAIAALALPEGLNRSLRSGNGWFTCPEKKLGRRIRSEFGPGQRFVSAKGRTSFYAEGENLILPSNPLEDIAAFMANRDIRFLVIDVDRASERRPELLDALEHSDHFVEYARARGKEADLIAYRFSKE